MFNSKLCHFRNKMITLNHRKAVSPIYNIYPADTIRRLTIGF